MKHFLLLLFALSSATAQTPFSSDSALSYLKTIAVDIGPRPMGSPGERRGMEFGLAKFREFGLHEAYIMKMIRAEGDIITTPYNTNSGIAVGVLRGTTNRIIVIGGHMDTAGPEVPGANDDGSGSAVVLELARVLSKERLQSTIMFCLFGGEEAGDCGSKYFVQHFPMLDSVALMLQVDMANGTDRLIPLIALQDRCAPKWLVEALYQEFEKLGYSGLRYPTNLFTFARALPGGGIGSDHEPFLEKGIPAIDVSSDIDDPIHTPQDDFEHFKPGGLKRSGDLFYALVHRFDGGVPSQKTDNYYLVQVGSQLFFIPLILLWIFVGLSVLLAIFALAQIREKQCEPLGAQRPVLPGVKLFLFAVFIQCCVWLSENLVGLVKGIRYPWVAHPGGYFVLGFFAALVGIAVSLRVSPYLRISRDPYRWFLRAAAFLLVFISVTALTGAQMTFYPAMALFFLSLAMLVRRPWLKVFFWLVSPHFMFRLIFSEGYIFFARGIAVHSIIPASASIVVHIVLILFFALWSFPFLLGFAAIYFSGADKVLRLEHWRKHNAVLVTSVAFVLCAAVVSLSPSYSDIWRSTVVANESIDLNTGEGKLVLRSNEYLKHLRVQLAERDTAISTWDREILLRKFAPDRKPWVYIDRTVAITGDSSKAFDIRLNLHFKYRPRYFTLSYSAEKSLLEDISTVYVYRTTGHSLSMRWEAFPDTSWIVPVHFRVAKADSVTEKLEAGFVELAEPVRIEREFTNISPRTTIRHEEVLVAH
jgi:hypothetical protein